MDAAFRVALVTYITLFGLTVVGLAVEVVRSLQRRRTRP
jgi:heme exporter protein D